MKKIKPWEVGLVIGAGLLIGLDGIPPAQFHRAEHRAVQDLLWGLAWGSGALIALVTVAFIVWSKVRRRWW